MNRLSHRDHPQAHALNVVSFRAYVEFWTGNTVHQWISGVAMSFEELKAVVKENHDTGTYSLCTIVMHPVLRQRLLVAFPPTGVSAGFTEAFEFNAAKHGQATHAQLFAGLTGIRMSLSESMPENTWKLVDPDGATVKEGTVE